ncbi:polysaccharide biosynthesis protein [Prevotella sp. LCP21S3_D2]|uniref:polysaccharide biosynthesis protein n=1 Tax=Prevotella sp. LCP21S3_D2 TaxID=3438800 RepID=UPI003F9ABDE8
MRDRNNQNGSSQTPYSGILYKLKVSLFANKLTNWYFSKATLPYWCILALDSIAIVIAGMIATYIAEGGEVIASHFWNYLLMFVCSLPLFVVGMRMFHTYSGIMRYSSFVDLLRISGALVVGFILNCVLLLMIPENILCEITTESIVVMLFISMIEMWTMRILVKYMYDSSFSAETKIPVFILGVREGGISLAKSMRNDHPSQYVVKGFTTEETAMVGRFLLGCEVYSYDETLTGVMHKMNVKTLFVSPLVTEKFLEKQDMIDKLTAEGIKIMMMPKAQSWDGKSNLRHQMMREVDIEDLLPRDKIEVDMNAIGKLLSGRTILITGAAGSIGSEMVKQIAIYKPQRLILVDEAETPMHDVRLFMNKNYADIPCETIVTSITNATRMERIFSENYPDYVFHAAAYKHVPMMEDNPAEAVQNNIYGTRVIADMAVKYGTRKFVMISTDKAVNPTNVMGCSKRICEIYCQALNKAIVDGEVKGVTQFVTTRFGNVLGSNGSVIPIFKKQIAMGGPITVTHPDIIRFFMLIPEACKLVLEAGTMGKGGEIFVFDMGKPVRIADLAKRMIALSGIDGIDIKYVGLRDGEKLFEEVLNDKEATIPTHHPKIMVAKVREYPYELARKNEEDLYQLSFTYDDMAIVKKMKEIVPEYKSQHSKYAELDNN